MPLREKAKALFKTRTRNSERADSLSKTSTNNSERDRWPSNVYKPGEPMPRPKYRRAPDPKHTENLEAFSFADAWRRKSHQSQYSPMGTRAPSRRNSWLSIGRKSLSRSKSDASRAKSITGAVSGDAERGGVKQREGLGVARRPRLTVEPEAEGDDDPTNVGLSRVQSRERQLHTRPRTAEDIRSGDQTNGMYQSISTAHDHQPFSEEELALAMKNSNLAVPTEPPKTNAD